jgi:hypothetical protein
MNQVIPFKSSATAPILIATRLVKCGIQQRTERGGSVACTLASFVPDCSGQINVGEMYRKTNQDIAHADCIARVIRKEHADSLKTLRTQTPVNSTPNEEEFMTTSTEKRKQGRPVGSKNKPKTEVPAKEAVATVEKVDGRLAKGFWKTASYQQMATELLKFPVRKANKATIDCKICESRIKKGYLYRKAFLDRAAHETCIQGERVKGELLTSKSPTKVKPAVAAHTSQPISLKSGGSDWQEVIDLAKTMKEAQPIVAENMTASTYVATVINQLHSELLAAKSEKKSNVPAKINESDREELLTLRGWKAGTSATLQIVVGEMMKSVSSALASGELVLSR